MIELVAAIQNKDYFKRLTPMGPKIPRDNNRYCVFLKDNGYDTKEYRHLKILVEEFIKAGKLKEIILVDPGRRAGKESAESRANELAPTRGVHIAGIIPAILCGTQNQPSSHTRSKRPRSGKINSIGTNSFERGVTVAPITSRESNHMENNNPYNDAVVITTLIADYQIDNILVETGSLVNLIFKNVFEKMKEGTTRLKPTSRPLFSFLDEKRTPRESSRSPSHVETTGIYTPHRRIL